MFKQDIKSHKGWITCSWCSFISAHFAKIQKPNEHFLDTVLRQTCTRIPTQFLKCNVYSIIMLQRQVALHDSLALWEAANVVLIPSILWLADVKAKITPESYELPTHSELKRRSATHCTVSSAFLASLVPFQRRSKSTAIDYVLWRNFDLQNIMGPSVSMQTIENEIPDLRHSTTQTWNS